VRKGRKKPLSTSPPESATDCRAEAEARGRAAFEAATASPEPTPEPPLDWLSSARRERPKSGERGKPGCRKEVRGGQA
jgi:hypothetical protein